MQGNFSDIDQTGTIHEPENVAPPSDGGIARTEGPAEQESPNCSAPEYFHVRDEASAEWVVRRINEARANVHRVEQWAATEIRQAREQERCFLGRYGAQLENWLRNELERRDLRRRSLALPSGTIGLRRLPPRLVIENESAALDWARRHLRLALRITISAAGADGEDLARWSRENCRGSRITERLALEDLNEYVGSTGELPNGVELRSGEERFYVG